MKRTLTARLLPTAALLLLAASASQAQTSPTQPISPEAVLPTLTYAFNHSSLVTLGNAAYDFNYYDFNITGFSNVGANNPEYDIYSFSNTATEKQPGVVAVASAYLPDGWTFTDTNDFLISIAPNRAIHSDDPAFGLIFIQTHGTPLVAPIGPFSLFHEPNGADPFTLNGVPVTITATPAVPEASTTVSLGLLLVLGAGGVTVAARRKKTTGKSVA